MGVTDPKLVVDDEYTLPLLLLLLESAPACEGVGLLATAVDDDADADSDEEAVGLPALAATVLLGGPVIAAVRVLLLLLPVPVGVDWDEYEADVLLTGAVSVASLERVTVCVELIVLEREADAVKLIVGVLLRAADALVVALCVGERVGESVDVGAADREDVALPVPLPDWLYETLLVTLPVPLTVNEGVPVVVLETEEALELEEEGVWALDGDTDRAALADKEPVREGDNELVIVCVVLVLLDRLTMPDSVAVADDEAVEDCVTLPVAADVRDKDAVDERVSGGVVESEGVLEEDVVCVPLAVVEGETDCVPLAVVVDVTGGDDDCVPLAVVVDVTGGDDDCVPLAVGVDVTGGDDDGVPVVVLLAPLLPEADGVAPNERLAVGEGSGRVASIGAATTLRKVLPDGAAATTATAPVLMLYCSSALGVSANRELGPPSCCCCGGGAVKANADAPARSTSTTPPPTPLLSPPLPSGTPPFGSVNRHAGPAPESVNRYSAPDPTGS